MCEIKIFHGKEISTEAIDKLNAVFAKWELKDFNPKPHECYKNARRLSIDSNNYFKYCEGYVIPNIESHAWNFIEDSIVDISIAPDGNYYTITGIPRILCRTPLVEYIYCGTTISYDNILEKEKEVGHLSGGSFESNDTNKYPILKTEF